MKVGPMKRLLLLLLVPFAAFAQAPACAPVPAYVTSWWPLDETSGTLAHDIRGAANDGRHFGSVAGAAGKVGGAACYNGIDASTVVPNGPEIDFPNHCEVDAGTSFTIDFWVKTDVTTGTYAILDKRDSDGSTFLRGYHVYVSYGRLGFQRGNGNGSLYCAPSGAACTNSTSPFFIADGQWHFAAVTIRQGCFTNSGTFYVDGVESSFPVTSTSLGNSADLYVGRRMPNLGGEYFPGCLDELELSSPSLTTSELNGIYGAGALGKCKPPVADACPILTACFGECGHKIVTQTMVTAAAKGIRFIPIDGSLCNVAMLLTVDNGTSSVTQRITFDAGPQSVDIPLPLSAGDVVSISAEAGEGDGLIICKREGIVTFALWLVH